MMAVTVPILLDNGCNSDVIAYSIFWMFTKVFKAVKRNLILHHLKGDSREDISEVVVKGILRKGIHEICQIGWYVTTGMMYYRVFRGKMIKGMK